MEFTKLLEERRSIRAFAPEKHVTAEQIQEIVQAAIQAPSWKNSQTTRYYALVTPEKVEEFSAKCLPEFNQKSSKGAALVVTAFVKDRSGFTQDGTPDNEVGNGWGYYDLGLHDENLQFYNRTHTQLDDPRYFDGIIDQIRAKDIVAFARKFFDTAQCIDVVIS